MYSFKVYINGYYKKTNVEINIEGVAKLSDLANEICRSKLNKIVEELNDWTHLYGFTDNLNGYFHNNPKYTDYVKQKSGVMCPHDFMRQLQGLPINEREKECHKTKIEQVFNTVGKKMLFAYDFGTTTEFIVRRIS